MPAKKNADNAPVDEPDAHTIPVPTEESDSEDGIHITFPVIANIVKMATMEVDGVCAVREAGEGIWETFGGRKGDKGVEVTVDEVGNYVIKIHVEMRFGVELAKIAKIVQEHVREQVERMTANGVSKVDVYIDAVRMETTDSDEKEACWNQPHTD